MSRRLLLPERDEVIAERLIVTRSRRQRMRGLIGHSLKPGEGLLLSPCRQVHTFGMSYPIDVVFCDHAWLVVHLVKEMVPGRITRLVRRSRVVVELPAGAAAGLEVGDRLLVEELRL